MGLDARDRCGSFGHERPWTFKPIQCQWLRSRGFPGYEARTQARASMDRLILFRHAKAERDSESGDDFDRPLAPRGRSEAKAMGEQLAALGFRPDLVLISPALRTRETWELAAEALPPGVETCLEPRLYNADSTAIRRLVSCLPCSV